MFNFQYFLNDYKFNNYFSWKREEKSVITKNIRTIDLVFIVILTT